MEQYEETIGLEIHVQLKTKSKMFCCSSAQYFGAQPNVHTCPVCLGLPGALPIINEEAISSAVKFALGLNCEVSVQSKFDRKNYFYPDLPKGYQISQYDLPIGINGWVPVGGKKIRINRAHQEEDTGKLIHARVNGESVSLVDFNRSGVPLMEIVSEPDIDSPQLAKEYAKTIHQVARYLEVADVDMEKAGMRFDANVSIKKQGTKTLGVKVEIKNINSFRFLEKALTYEIKRQIKVLESGGQIDQETRGWVETKGVTVSQRSKETSPDYRYFPEPDLPPLTFESKNVSKVKRSLPELPWQKEKRFGQEFNLDKNSVQILTEDKYLAQWFENALILYAKGKRGIEPKAKTLANWVVGEFLRIMKEKNLSPKEVPIEPAELVELLYFIDKGKINQTIAKKVFALMFESGKMPAKIIEEQGFSQDFTEGNLKKVVDEAITENPKAAADFRKGKEASLGFLVGQVMRKTGGKGDPKVVTDLLKLELSNGD
ncbi:MAG: Asp-tRNA(Asn)/Glu-tRNA(Gln) amidotransferase subunit GatB [Candidatus Woykebacteria bacterium]